MVCCNCLLETPHKLYSKVCTHTNMEQRTQKLQETVNSVHRGEWTVVTSIPIEHEFVNGSEILRVSYQEGNTWMLEYKNQHTGDEKALGKVHSDSLILEWRAFVQDALEIN